MAYWPAKTAGRAKHSSLVAHQYFELIYERATVALRMVVTGSLSHAGLIMIIIILATSIILLLGCTDQCDAAPTIRPTMRLSFFVFFLRDGSSSRTLNKQLVYTTGTELV
jgi:hypothetical protein